MRSLLSLLAALLLVAACRTNTPLEPAVSSLVRIEVLKGVPTDGPLVVGMHGLGDVPQNHGRLYDSYGGNGRFVLPQAPLEHGRGFSWFPVRVRDSTPAEVAPHVAKAADEAAVLLRELMAAQPWAGKPVVTGFSQGGMMSFALATRHPELVSMAIPVAGWLPEPLWPATVPSGAPPIRALHGTADTVLPIEPTRRGIAHLKALGWDAELEEYPGVQHTITPQMRSVIFRWIEVADGERAK